MEMILYTARKKLADWEKGKGEKVTGHYIFQDGGFSGVREGHFIVERLSIVSKNGYGADVSGTYPIEIDHKTLKRN